MIKNWIEYAFDYLLVPICYNMCIFNVFYNIYICTVNYYIYEYIAIINLTI